MPFLGCVADDFTGASDAASFLVKGGMSVQLFNGIPDEEAQIADGVQALVIALKSRTQRKAEAVRDSLSALKWLKQRGAVQFYLKYCSTFDSTPEGNIGPVADAAMEFLQVPYTILCPALPVNGRTVKNGRLFVNGVPLEKSSMKNHPLTPMWDCRIAKLMESQSRYSCIELRVEQMERPEAKIWRSLNEKAGMEAYYVIPDYENEKDGERIAELFGGLKLLTGGSGLLEPLARRLCRTQKNDETPDIKAAGAALMLAGSCSRVTLDQIEYYKACGGLSYKIDPVAMLAGKETTDNAWKFIEENWGKTVLIYSSDTAEQVKMAQQSGLNQVADMLEQMSASLAERAVEKGIRRMIVAGGETSGAVTKRLGFCSYQIGSSVAPGVPVMIPVENPELRLVLKSGNFGQRDFFEKVLQITAL